MHPTRLEILRELRKAETKTFSVLLRDVAETSDNLTYHIKHMMRDGIVESPQKGVYQLAEKGRELINTNQDKYVGLFPTLSVMIVVTDGKGSRLLMRKLKQPHIGKLHDITFGLWSYGTVDEQIDAFCKKYRMELKDIEYKKVFRKRVADKHGEVTFDKTFLVYTATLVGYEREVDDRQFELIPAPLLGEHPDVLGSTADITLLIDSAAAFCEKCYDAG
jgi:DNA-binding transcriptional ArsR family regulator